MVVTRTPKALYYLDASSPRSDATTLVPVAVARSISSVVSRNSSTGRDRAPDCAVETSSIHFCPVLPFPRSPRAPLRLPTGHYCNARIPFHEQGWRRSLLPGHLPKSQSRRSHATPPQVTPGATRTSASDYDFHPHIGCFPQSNDVAE